METWKDAKRDADHPDPDTEQAKKAIESAWDEVRQNFDHPECGMMPENPVEYHEKARRES